MKNFNQFKRGKHLFKMLLKEDNCLSVNLCCQKLIIKMANLLLQMMDYVQDHLQGSPLHLAAKYGNLFFCKSVIDQIEDKEFQPNYKKKTPLHNATVRGQLPLCEFMLDMLKNVFTLQPDNVQKLITKMEFYSNQNFSLIIRTKTFQIC